MKVDLYTVENPMVYNKNLEKSLANLLFTQEIHEKRDTYESDNKPDEPMAGNNIIRKAFINVVFFERVHQVAYKEVMADSEFLTAEEVSSQLLSQLEESLSTKEQKELLLELESAWDSKYAIFLEYSYCQGIADSPMIHKQLEKYGIWVVKESAEYDYTLPVSTSIIES
ncbi:hypothetical protein [Siminovitchia sp. 179-K 8D1 HS]|uniref:hypothetical protein n=1 Tax=Siminovitchia sp. 179-K 8D1 HS TaxID=3142385 RepID=UPI0039A140EE